MPRGALPGKSHGPLQVAFREQRAMREAAARGEDPMSAANAPAGPPPGVLVRLSPFQEQEEFMEAALCGRFLFLLYGGAIRSGKTFVVMGLILLLAKKYPGSRWIIMRRTFGDLRRTVIPSFDKIRPRPFAPEINHQTMTCKCANGSEILFLAESITSDPELLKFRGLEANGIVLEEAHELSRRTFEAAQERAGTWIVPGLEEQPPSLVLLTCNPGQGWVKETFHDPYVGRTLKAPYYFKQAYPESNPYISDGQKAQWKNLPEHVYRRMILGDWTVSDDPHQIIPYQKLHERLILDEIDLRALAGIESLGVDYGGAAGNVLSGDLTAFAHMRGATMYECSAWPGLIQPTVASMVKQRMIDRGISARNVGIDAGGEGSGVETILRAQELYVQRLLAGRAPTPDDMRMLGDKSMLLQFRNLKGVMWWKFRRDVIDPDSDLRIVNDSALVQDLTAVHYRETDAKIIIEEKSETKKRIGRSPDRGDAAVMANYVRGAKEAEFVSGISGGDAGGGTDSIYSDIDSLWGDGGNILEIYQ